MKKIRFYTDGYNISIIAIISQFELIFELSIYETKLNPECS